MKYYLVVVSPQGKIKTAVFENMLDIKTEIEKAIYQDKDWYIINFTEHKSPNIVSRNPEFIKMREDDSPPFPWVLVLVVALITIILQK